MAHIIGRKHTAASTGRRRPARAWEASGGWVRTRNGRASRNAANTVVLAPAGSRGAAVARRARAKAARPAGAYRKAR